MSASEPAPLHVPGLYEPMPATKEVSFGDDGPDFLSQLLDVVNPLQHVPVVATIYRALTGDAISAPARLLGGALFGGPLGFASASANLLLEEATGRGLAEHAFALLRDAGEEPVEPAGGPAAADAAPAASPPASRAAASAAAAEAGGQIIWNGSRVVPSLARAVPLDVAPPPRTAAAGVPGGESDGAATAPAWLAVAIADARSVHASVQAGRTPPKPDAQPWVTRAMLDALDKYEAMARARAR